MKEKFIKISTISPLENSTSNFTILSINREKYLNAVNLDVIREFTEKLCLLSSDDKCKAVIITGAGNKSFIAGADIRLMSDMSPDEAHEYSESGHNLCNMIASFSKPVIAAVNGYALGGGCEIALSCHMRFSNSSAIFAQPEVSLGILAGWGGTQRLPRIIGYSNSFDLLLSGRKINSEEAYRIGLVNKIIDGDLINGIIEYTSSILTNSSNAISKTIESINNSMNFIHSDSLLKETELFKDTFKHNDSKEGLESFINKRKPKF